MQSRRELMNGLAGCATACALSLPIGAVAASPAGEGQALADKLVEAMGGHAALRVLQGLSVRARHFETDVEQPYDNALFISLAEPRMRFEGRSATMNRVRAVVGNAGWRVSESAPLGPLSEQVVRSDLEWWETHVYRNVWRLARRDPSIRPARHADGRLELYRTDGSRLMWYRLNMAGEPVAFGRLASDQTATILGPLQDVRGGVRLPVFSSSSDGTFRAVDQKGEVYRTDPPVDFTKP